MKHQYIQLYILLRESKLILVWLRIQAMYMELQNWRGTRSRERTVLQAKKKGNSGNHGLVGVKVKDGGKATSGSGNDVGTQSAENGSEDSSDASDDNQVLFISL